MEKEATRTSMIMKQIERHAHERIRVEGRDAENFAAAAGEHCHLVTFNSEGLRPEVAAPLKVAPSATNSWL
eukprot:CAMPEP_0198704560 /NCGR_PEP_ID=MMETSP1468-20131203/389968_1 /TAXON_ID=1461545 /ORGANISM="Mantoniella sp, Strain CCMP1436" /LENGTH=70 /DNA_ID=CAMNT_0044463381 /DNA_START=1117 /DNA_END=1329 /DNA_ORIENTATION=-